MFTYYPYSILYFCFITLYVTQPPKNRGWTHMLRKGKQSWFTCGNRCFILVTNLMTSHEWGKDRENSSGLCTQCLAYLFTLDYVMKYSYSQTSAKLFQTNYIKVTILMVYQLFTLQNSHKSVKTKIIFFVYSFQRSLISKYVLKWQKSKKNRRYQI